MVFAVAFALVAAVLGVLFIANVRNLPADLLESALQHWNRRVRGIGWIVRQNEPEPLRPSAGAIRVATVGIGIGYFVVGGVAIALAASA